MAKFGYRDAFATISSTIAQASCGQQNGNREIRSLCDLSRELDFAAAALLETERRSCAIQDGDTIIEGALEFHRQRSMESQAVSV